LDFAVFDADRAEVWQRARDVGVQRAFVPGVKPSQWAGLAALRTAMPEICFGVGVHPFFLHDQSADELHTALATLAETAQSLGAVAIGECGLDARVPKRGGPSLAEQEAVLSAQIAVARTSRLPLVLHAVDTHGRLLQLLEDGGPLPAGGALHAYSGSAELVPRYAKLGLYFGFGGALTRPSARRAWAALKAVPRDRLLLETDAPDQPPYGWQGAGATCVDAAAMGDPGAVHCNEPAAPAAQSEPAPRNGPPRAARNEPAALLWIARAICEQWGGTADELAQITTNNALTLFGGPRVC
jgi:TatD DNase family protein